jgi:hypothetical protein
MRLWTQPRGDKQIADLSALGMAFGKTIIETEEKVNKYTSV